MQVLNTVRIIMTANEFNNVFDATAPNSDTNTFVGNNGTNGLILLTSLTGALITFGSAFMTGLYLRQGSLATKFAALAGTLVSLAFEGLALGYAAKTFDIDSDCGETAGSTSTVLCLTDEYKAIGALSIVVAIIQFGTAAEIYGSPAEGEPGDSETKDSKSLMVVGAVSGLLHFLVMVLASKGTDDEFELRSDYLFKSNEASSDVQIIGLQAALVGLFASFLAMIHKDKHAAATKHAALGLGVLASVFYAVAFGFAIKQFTLDGNSDCTIRSNLIVGTTVTSTGACDAPGAVYLALGVFVIVAFLAELAFVFVVTNSGPSDAQGGGPILVVLIAVVSLALLVLRTIIDADQREQMFDETGSEFFEENTYAGLYSLIMTYRTAIPIGAAAALYGLFHWKSNTLGSTAMTMSLSFLSLVADIQIVGFALKNYSQDPKDSCVVHVYSTVPCTQDEDKNTQALGGLAIIQLVVTIVYLVVVWRSNPKLTA